MKKRRLDVQPCGDEPSESHSEEEDESYINPNKIHAPKQLGQLILIPSRACLPDPPLQLVTDTHYIYFLRTHRLMNVDITVEPDLKILYFNSKLVRPGLGEDEMAVTHYFKSTGFKRFEVLEADATPVMITWVQLPKDADMSDICPHWNPTPAGLLVEVWVKKKIPLKKAWVATSKPLCPLNNFEPIRFPK